MFLHLSIFVLKPSFVLATLIVLAAPAQAANFLEIWLTKEADGTGGFRYGVELEGLNKDGATSCKIATASGTSTCVRAEGGAGEDDSQFFLPDQSFLDQRAFSNFSSLLTEIETDWTITWDEGLPTQTVATIDFLTEMGDITEESWSPVHPRITNPADGAAGVLPTTSIDWDYGGVDPETVDPDGIAVILRRTGNEFFAEQRFFDLEGCTGVCSSVTPEPVLAAGTWRALVANGDSSGGDRPVPLGISTDGAPWVLENEGWLGLESIGRAEFEVVPEPSPGILLGAALGVVAALRRRLRSQPHRSPGRPKIQMER
jgi:hypothetical protein